MKAHYHNKVWCIRSTVQKVVLFLLAIVLYLTAGSMILAQSPDKQDVEPADETAKRASQVRGGEQPLPVRDKGAGDIFEGFESGIMPPSGWTRIQTNPNETWQTANYNPYTGSYHAAVWYDPALLNQDEILLSPSFTANSGIVELWSYGSLYWCRDTYDNCDLEIWFVRGSWGGSDDVFLGRADDGWTGTYQWSSSTFDFSPYASGTPARIAFRYTGYDGAEVALDDITINIGDVGPLVYNNHTIDDDNIGNSNGNGDGIADCGETIELYAELFNQGSDTATGVNATISTTDPYVTFFINTDSTYPDITGGGTGTNSNDFDFILDPGAPDGHVIHFDLNVTASNGGPWSDSFDVIVSCPPGTVGPLVYNNHTIDDDNIGNSNGDGDGIADCGETIELYAELFNQGSDTATGVNATISTTDPYVTFFINTSSLYPDITGGGTGTNSNDFDFILDPGAPDGHVIHFDLNVTASNGGPWSDSFDVIVSCPPPPTTAEWTFMVYLDGDNNLETNGIDDFLEMSSVGSNSDLNILVQFDRIPGFDSSHGDWTTTKRFRVTSGMTPTAANAIQDLGEINMGDPQSLIDFAQWGIANYPANHYAIIVWDHGSGWRLRTQDQPLFKDVASDNTSGGDALDMPELRNLMDTISNGGVNPIDLIGFDACLMAMIEVDNQLIPYANVRVGSEETEPADGWPYDDILSVLVANPGMSANQLGTTIVNDYYASYGNSQTQSAIDLGASYSALNTAVDNFAAALINGMGSYSTEISNARGSSQEFFTPAYIDLYDFAHKINLTISDATINAAATAVINAVNGTVIRDQHGSGWPGAHGITIYFPETSGGYNDDYDGDANWLQFTASTRWDEWLHCFYGEGCASSPPLDVYFLVDLSGSFYDDLPTFKTQASTILSVLSASNPNTRFGIGKFEDYPISPFGNASYGDKAYERLVDLTFDTTPVLNTINGLYTRSGMDWPESQLPALYQTATGVGQDLSGAGYPGASIPAGQQANFRTEATKLIVLWTDAPFHHPGDPGDIPYPGPSFIQTAIAINALGDAFVLGIYSGPGPTIAAVTDQQNQQPLRTEGILATSLPDLEAIVTATGAFAGDDGVDCNDDGIIDISPGQPLVCTVGSAGEGIGEAMIALVEAERGPAKVFLPILIKNN